jgi:hypothetical protein
MKILAQRRLNVAGLILALVLTLAPAPVLAAEAGVGDGARSAVRRAAYRCYR